MFLMYIKALGLGEDLSLAQFSSSSHTFPFSVTLTSWDRR